MKRFVDRIICIAVMVAVIVTTVPLNLYASEAQDVVWSYVLFAGSDEEGAISLFTGNTCVNGNICSNGSVYAQGHINLNGTITENAGVEIPDLWQWIESREKSGDIISYDESVFIYDDLRLCNENVLACENGDITIDCTQAEINSLVYAPNGTVSISAENLNMNSVIIIAERIEIISPNMNANYNSALGRKIFVTEKGNEDNSGENNGENTGENTGDNNGEGNGDNNAEVNNENGGDNGDDEKNLYTVTFDLCGISDAIISDQSVYEGEYVDVPEEPEAEGYMFLGWDKDPEHKTYFDPEKDVVTEDLHLYAYWYNETDETDTDEDGIKDELEKLLGLDPYSEDTDNDGLPDNMETDISMMDSTKYDTDEDGIPDGQEDFDEDGLINTEEIALGTDFCNNDTDGDVLSDGEEYLVYDTDPLNSDTDEDGVNDYREISFGSDPLVYDSMFDVVYSIDKDDYEEADIDFSVSLCSIDAEQADSLNVMPVINDTLFPTDMPGYMGCAYDLSMVGTFEEAVLTFEFDTDKYAEDVDPVVYYFDEEEQELIPLETVVSGNKAIAVTNHFSTYVLVNRKIYEKSFEFVDHWNLAGKNSLENLEILYMSGETISMNEPDLLSKRKEDAYYFVDSLPGKTVFCAFEICQGSSNIHHFVNVSDFNKNAFMFGRFYTVIDYSDKCALNRGIESSLYQFKMRKTTAEKVMIVAFDGSNTDADKRYDIVDEAKKLGVRIYCVGYGSNKEFFDDYMTYISAETGGKIYDGNSSTWVDDLLLDLQMGVDIKLDTDKDGLPDFYEDYMPLFNGVVLKTDKNNPDTDGDGLLDGNEVKSFKSIFSPDMKKAKVEVKLKFNPVKEDSDGDGLSDYYPFVKNGEVVIPPDNKPMDYNGPKGVWREHVLQMLYGDVATEYASSGSQAELNKALDEMEDQRVANRIRKNVNKLMDLSRNVVINTEEELDSFLKKYSKLFEAIITPIRYKYTFLKPSVIPAICCNFVADDLGQAYHAIPVTWQKKFGYTNLFDDAFRIGTDMNKDIIDFVYDDQDYRLWLWKGDYWALGTGAEVGIYKMSEETSGENPTSAAAHYDAVDFLLPMQLSLYRTNCFNILYDYYNWKPIEPQWWITGFDPEHLGEKADNMVVVTKINLSDKKDLKKALIECKDLKKELSDYIFYNDDLWFVWR